MLVSRRVATLLENSAVCSRLQQRVTLSYDVAVQAAKQLQALPTMNPRMALSMRYRIMRLCWDRVSYGSHLALCTM